MNLCNDLTLTLIPKILAYFVKLATPSKVIDVVHVYSQRREGSLLSGCTSIKKPGEGLETVDLLIVICRRMNVANSVEYIPEGLIDSPKATPGAGLSNIKKKG